MNSLSRTAREQRVAWISVIANLLLTAAKILVGWWAVSEALFADGLHSAADLFASAIALSVIGYANKPADEDHPYGHGKAEVVISGIIGIILVLVALYVIISAVLNIIHGPTRSPELIALWTALVSFALKWWLYRFSLQYAKKFHSKAIEAIAYDHKADIIASLAAALGIALAIVGALQNWPVLFYADPLAGIVVSFLILHMAWQMLLEAFHILLEHTIDPEELKAFESIILSFPEVKRIDRIRARDHGHYILLDVRISVPYDLSVQQGHDLGRSIKQALMKQYDHIQEVLIHLNPYHADNHPDERLDERLKEYPKEVERESSPERRAEHHPEYLKARHGSKNAGERSTR
ncbi:MAG: cation transporter [Candidatus Carbobacillus altaicus]|nr:cation transporter [Candidatus Carbobacillus altaicus]